MKQTLQRFILKIDAMSLRERIMIFAGTALTLMLLLNTLLFDPQFAQQKLLSQKIQSDQSKIAEMQAEIQQKVTSQTSDPDTVNKKLLQKLQQQSQQMHADLLGLNDVLVKPENMTSLLETILKRNGTLRLISLNTLPVSTLTPVAANAATIPAEKSGVPVPAASAAAPSALGTGEIYKHGVEIVVQGKYLDMMAYMSALEAMPWQLFWGKAKMQVETYPEATLSLTLFTLSLDKKWLNL
ncbi:MAG: MSHA biogenesis protein MshJ [Glaciimonas sp.]|nr:MSHA biogenesis protein MshJ [Glaciimonas sp.]